MNHSETFAVNDIDELERQVKRMSGAAAACVGQIDMLVNGVTTLQKLGAGLEETFGVIDSLKKSSEDLNSMLAGQCKSFLNYVEEVKAASEEHVSFE